jgi:hypothetical protein
MESTITVGPAEMTWDAGSRLAVLRFEREMRATGTDAEKLIEALTHWIGAEGRPFALLGDGGNLAGVDAAYRASWGKFLRQHRAECSIAFFNMSPVVRIAAEMFRIGTGLQLKAFAREGEARAWLQQRGIAA